MPRTEWGSEISFGWELEGTTEKILNWYEPSDEMQETWGLTAGEWRKWPPQKQSAHVRQLIRDNKYLFGGLRWSKFVRRPDAPNFVCQQLKEEAGFRTWEVNSDTSRSVEELFAQMERARAEVAEQDAANGAQAAGFQVHIVFHKPLDEREKWNGYLAALFTLLNDYAAMKDAAAGNENFTNRLVGNSPLTPRDVAIHLTHGIPLDFQLSPGQIGGPQKYNFVGFRDFYGEDRIGFEIREGWTGNWARFRDLVTRVVAHLGAISHADIHIKRQRSRDARAFDLVDHFLFYEAAADATPEFLNRLFVEAELVVAQSKETVALPEVLYRRWRRAFLKWEEHPALAGAGVQIASERVRLVKKIQKYFAAQESALKRRASVMPNAALAVDSELVSREIAEFFKRTRIHSFL